MPIGSLKMHTANRSLHFEAASDALLHRLKGVADSPIARLAFSEKLERLDWKPLA